MPGVKKSAEKMQKTFAVIYILTVILARLAAWFLTIYNAKHFSGFWHHLYTGLIILFTVLIFKGLLSKKLSVILLAIAAALIADELFLVPVSLFAQVDPVEKYWSYYSWLGMFFLSLLILKARRGIIKYI
ncbi:hypothetical protein C4572_04295 [Candidatus Parcubacteria bacterium]|nr:MAG: hypothetical protein C4572_04295 [Candidatus Parcubacteria bacterium]